MCLTTGHVRRSKTFNISDVHEQLLATGGGGPGAGQQQPGAAGCPLPSGTSANGTKTLPKPDKNRSGASSYNLRPQLTRTGACLDENFRNTDSGSGSRKSSDSSSFDSATSGGSGGHNRHYSLRNDICDDALNEIAAFESFITDFVTRQSDTASGTSSSGGMMTSSRKLTQGGGASPKSSTSGSLVSGVSGSSKNYENNNNNDYTRMMMSYHQGSKTLSKEDLKTKRLLVTSSRMVRTLERQKKVVVSPQASEEALLP